MFAQNTLGRKTKNEQENKCASKENLFYLNNPKFSEEKKLQI